MTLMNTNTDKMYTRTFFGYEIDIRDYQKNYEAGLYDDQIPDQVGGKFLEFYWHDLKSGYNFYDNPELEELSNIGIRTQQDTKRNNIDFIHVIITSGWSLSYYPPIFDTTGKPRNGRKRIRTCISNNERWIPAARWTYKIDSVLSQDDLNERISIVSTGLQANAPTDHSEPFTFDDVKEGGRQLVKLYAEDGKVFNTPTNIDTWFAQMNINRHFSVDTVKKLKQAILNIDKDGNDHMIMMTRVQAEAWLQKCEVLKSRGIEKISKQSPDATERVVLYSPGDTNCIKCLCFHILPNAAEGIKTRVVLYTLGSDPKESVKDVRSFKSKLKKTINNFVKFAQNDVSGITLNVPFDSSMWSVEGAVPQKRFGDNEKKHVQFFREYRLISTEDY